jgi:hypothetical protein
VPAWSGAFTVTFALTGVLWDAGVGRERNAAQLPYATKRLVQRILRPLSWKPMEKFYSLDDVYLDFNFTIQISKFILDGAYVKPNLKMADDVAGTILNVMYDTDYLRDEINNVIYDVMADEIDVTKVDDLYYQVLFYISKIDGFEVNGRYSNYYDLEPNMFI